MSISCKSALDAGESYARLARGDFHIKEDCGVYAFRLDGWICAERHGNVTSDRQDVSLWEQFTFIPLEYVPLSSNEEPALPLFRRRSGIPKIVHQICISESNKLPTIFVDNIASLKMQNIDYVHRIWYLKDVYDAIYDWFGFEVLKIFLQINPRYRAAQADFFRYCLIYKLGGVYLDLKAGASRPLSSIIHEEDSFLLSGWDCETRPNFGFHAELAHIPTGEYQQWFIISEAGHPFLERVLKRVLHCISRYSSAITGTGIKGVLRTTGPIPYTLAIAEILHDHPHRFINSEKVGLIFSNVKDAFSGLGRHYSKLEDDVVLNASLQNSAP